MKNLLPDLEAALRPHACKGIPPEILTPDSPGFAVQRQVNNTKFQFIPWAIVLVETTEQVSAIVKFANQHPAEIILRVRSGGHDHEGECSGTDTLLIDFSKMHAVDVTWREVICAAPRRGHLDVLCRGDRPEPGRSPFFSEGGCQD